MTEAVLDIDRDRNVVLLTLTRQELRNALNLQLCRAIHEAAQAAVDDAARVVVITGRGTAFCSGADLGGVYGPAGAGGASRLGGTPTASVAEGGGGFLEALYGMLHGLTRLPIPIIAAVNGPAIGAGTQLALACDLRVADATARFAVPTAKNGMAVDGWTIRTLAQLAGTGRARRLLLAAEELDVDEAITSGLVDRRGSLADALAWAQEIADLAPLALAHNKLALNGGDDAAVDASFDAVWASEDVREAAAARAEKRPPTFTGR